MLLSCSLSPASILGHTYSRSFNLKAFRWKQGKFYEFLIVPSHQTFVYKGIPGVQLTKKAGSFALQKHHKFSIWQTLGWFFFFFFKFHGTATVPGNLESFKYTAPWIFVKRIEYYAMASKGEATFFSYSVLYQMLAIYQTLISKDLQGVTPSCLHNSLHWEMKISSRGLHRRLLSHMSC